MKKNIKLKFAQDRFLGKCPACGQKLKKVDGVNILRCENTFCNGVPVYKNGIPEYQPYYRMLDSRGMEIYEHLFK